jgi:hypothetical protein
VPAQVITYRLDPGAPAGASINPTNGLFSWTPSTAQARSTNRIVIRAVDNGSPSASAAQTVNITVAAGFTTNVTLIATGSVWKFRDTGEDLGTAWRTPAFDDSSWAAGPAKLGYGDDLIVTVVSFGADEDSKYITTYFRRSLLVSEPANVSALNMRAQRDDGLVVYLNGAEVWRNNMPAGAITYLTTASTSGDDGEVFVSSSALDASLLVAGNNVVAVEVHQRSGSSGDIAFDLELTGTQSMTSLSAAIVPPWIRIAIDSAASLQWNAHPGATYRVQYTTNLFDGVWSDLGEEILATDVTASAVDATAPGQQRFYRVLLMQ